MKATLQYRNLTTPEECLQSEELQRAVWGEYDLHVIPWRLTLDLIHGGSLVLGAYDGETLVGFIIGFLGTDHKSPNRPAMARLKHTSHIMGVHPDYRDAGVGFILKSMQRDHAIQQGVRLVTWTYDPLQSRNAYLNIRRLGAVCNDYIREYYGKMEDEINMGIPSDRFRVEWWVTSNHVKNRLESGRASSDLAALLSSGAKKLNSTELNSKGILEPIDGDLELGGSTELVEIPSDINALREIDPDLAISWRFHTRKAFEVAFKSGFMITDFLFIKDEKLPRSYYVLSFGEDLAE